MTEEMEKTTSREECFCKSKGFRKFLVVAGGSFVGVFCALSLFAALHKPPMPMMPPMGPMMGGFNHPYVMGHHMKHFKKHNCDCPCHKKMMKDMKKGPDKMKDLPKQPEIDD